jgi:hypothetical protein
MQIMSGSGRVSIHTPDDDGDIVESKAITLISNLPQFLEVSLTTCRAMLY